VSSIPTFLGEGIFRLWAREGHATCGKNLPGKRKMTPGGRGSEGSLSRLFSRATGELVFSASVVVYSSKDSSMTRSAWRMRESRSPTSCRTRDSVLAFSEISFRVAIVSHRWRRCFSLRRSFRGSCAAKSRSASPRAPWSASRVSAVTPGRDREWRERDMVR